MTHPPALRPRTLYLSGVASLHRLKGGEQLQRANGDPSPRQTATRRALARTAFVWTLAFASTAILTGLLELALDFPFCTGYSDLWHATKRFSDGLRVTVLSPHPHPHPPCHAPTRPASSHAYRSEPRATDTAPPTVQDGGQYCGIAAIITHHSHHRFSLPIRKSPLRNATRQDLAGLEYGYSTGIIYDFRWIASAVLIPVAGQSVSSRSRPAGL